MPSGQGEQGRAYGPGGPAPDPQGLVHSHLPVHHGLRVLPDLYGGRLPEGLCGDPDRPVERRSGCSAVCGGSLRYGYFPGMRRYYCRCGGNHHLPPQHLYPVPGPGPAGGQRLYVKGGLRDGRDHGQAGTFRKGLHPHAPGLRMHGAGHYGFQGPGKPQGQAEDHAGDPLHVLFRKAADLYPFFRDLLPGAGHAGSLFHVSDRHPHGDPYGLCDQPGG